MSGAYIPPHLRNRSAASSSLPIASSSNATSSATSVSALTDKSRRLDAQRPHSSDRAGNSRTPWSRTTPASSSRQDDGDTWPTYDPPSNGRVPGTGAATSRTPLDGGRSSSGPGRPRPMGVGSPTLYVYGDSFVGPMKLLSEECSRRTTYKGASAKGLNNPNSAKQVAKLLLPALNDLLAPPPYRYMPTSGRWALLVFGNVDLQINYLWQLQNKQLSHLSFPQIAAQSDALAMKPGPGTENTVTDQEEEVDTDTEGESSEPIVQRSVLARATETSLTGPSLGPELFVQAVIKAYTSWLEREVVNGPVGEQLRAAAEKRRRLESGEEKGKVPPPGKVLIAAALPPLVEDDTLPRIPEKYVERLEEEHEKAQKLLETDERSWRDSEMKRSHNDAGEDVEVGMATVQLTDRPGTPISTGSSGSAASSTGFELSTVSDQSSQSSANSSPASKPDPTTSSPTSGSSKTTIQSLLKHDPPLCTLPVRVQMTNTYNALLSSFCSKHPDVLSFIDIAPRMHAQDAKSGWTPGQHGEVDRGTWACPVDPTNVHPLWEPTLPLWLEALGEEGLPTHSYTMEEGADETFRAYELDKRKRTAKRGEEDAERVKLRDE